MNLINGCEMVNNRMIRFDLMGGEYLLIHADLVQAFLEERVKMLRPYMAEREK